MSTQQQQEEDVKRVLLNAPAECKQELFRRLYFLFYEDKSGEINCPPMDTLFRVLRFTYNDLMYYIRGLRKAISPSDYFRMLSGIEAEALRFIDNLTEAVENLTNNTNVILGMYRDVFTGFKYACYNALTIAKAIVRGEKYEHIDNEFNDKLGLLVDYYVYDAFSFLFSRDLNIYGDNFEEKLMAKIPEYAKYIRDPLEQLFVYSTASIELRRLEDVGERTLTYKCYILQKDSENNPNLKLICRQLSNTVDKAVVGRELGRINKRAFVKMREFFLDLARKGVDPEQFCKTFRPEDVISEEIREYNDVIKKYGIFIFELNLPLKARKL